MAVRKLPPIVLDDDESFFDPNAMTPEQRDGLRIFQVLSNGQERTIWAHRYQILACGAVQFCTEIGVNTFCRDSLWLGQGDSVKELVPEQTGKQAPKSRIQ